MLRILFLIVLVLAAANDPAQAARSARPLTPQVVNDAQWSGTASDRSGPVLLKAQVLLDRAGFSPGAIDARDGENFAKALRAFQQAYELEPTGKLGAATWDRLVHTSDEPVLRDYTTIAGMWRGRSPRPSRRISRRWRGSTGSPTARLVSYSRKNSTYQRSSSRL
jgi:peptidoglycan hydrolase-like protein with peptidoglycan-binding domain